MAVTTAKFGHVTLGETPLPCANGNGSPPGVFDHGSSNLTLPVNVYLGLKGAEELKLTM
jgi:hypothetical protein